MSTEPTADRVAPLSYAQERFWLLERMAAPGSGAPFNIPFLLRLSVPVRPELLRRCIEDIMRRHEILRTRIAFDGTEALQRVGGTGDPPFEVIDLRDPAGGAADPEAAWERATREGARRFDLEAEPPFRARLYRIAEQDHLLLAVFHHIACDGWSVGVFHRELLATYAALAAGRAPDLPRLPTQYASYAEQQRRVLDAAAREKLLFYWSERLRGLRRCELPADHPAPASPASRSRRTERLLAPSLVAALAALCRREAVTPFMVLLAALAIIVQRWTGRDDVAIGTSDAGRTRPELEPLIGCFLNTLVLRLDLSGDPRLSALIAQVRETALGAYAHRELPIELLVRELHPERRGTEDPFFQVYLNYLALDEALPGGAAPETPADSALDVALYARPEGDALRLTLLMRLDLFREETAARLMSDLEALLTAMAEHPEDRLSALPLAAEREPATPSQVPPAWPERSITERFAAVARAFPQRQALDDGQRGLTYAALARMAAAIAAQLAAASTARGRVCVLMQPSHLLVGAVLGVLRAGHAYVPLEPTHPRERHLAVIAEVQPWAILADASQLSEVRVLAAESGALVIAPDPQHPPAADVAACPIPGSDDLAYVLFTSGTTGKPKGVMQLHGRVLQHARAYGASIGLCAEDRLPMLASIAYDAAVMDLFGALLHGACLTLPDLRGDAAQARACLAQASVLHGTPTLLRLLLEDAGFREAMGAPRVVVLGGEPATAGDLHLLRDRLGEGVSLVNGLGPSECTVALQHHLVPAAPIPAEPIVPVGRPVPGVEVRVVNADTREVGLLGVGEIQLRAAALTPGYWQRPDLNARAFVADAADRRWYCTGDLGRRRRDGGIDYVGRRDRRLKLRGIAVEPGEIEARLLAHPTIRAAAVTARAGVTVGQEQLVAYLVLAGEMVPEVTELRAFLRRSLPDAMVPSIFACVDALPVMANGKLDRDALPAPGEACAMLADRGTGRVPIAPRDALEAIVAAKWREVLGGGASGIEEDFFALGGHSLLAMQVVARIRAEIWADFSVRHFFAAPTVAGCAAAVRAGRGGAMPDAAPPLRAARDRHRILLRTKE